MYSQQELDDAVASGVITADAANALRAHVQGERSTAIPDEEQFRLITGFNDIFVSIAAAILLFAVGWIGQSIGQSAGLVVGEGGPSFIAPLAVAATSWGLALFFTAKRRMALPSIVLLLSFVIGVFAAAGIGLATVVGDEALDNNNLLGRLAGLRVRSHCAPLRPGFTGAASAFRSPSPRAPPPWPRIAVGLLARPRSARMSRMQGMSSSASCSRSASAIFLFAMWWDGSDRGRLTRRADVAFWLHLLAAPMIVHPIFTLLGLNDGHATIGEGVVVILLYVALGITALAIDRRALAGLSPRLCAVRDAAAVPRVRRGRAECRAHRAGDRLGAADAVGLLAPGPGGDRPAASGKPSRPAADPRSDRAG